MKRILRFIVFAGCLGGSSHVYGQVKVCLSASCRSASAGAGTKTNVVVTPVITTKPSTNTVFPSTTTRKIIKPTAVSVTAPKAERSNKGVTKLPTIKTPPLKNIAPVIKNPANLTAVMSHPMPFGNLEVTEGLWDHRCSRIHHDKNGVDWNDQAGAANPGAMMAVSMYAGTVVKMGSSKANDNWIDVVGYVRYKHAEGVYKNAWVLTKYIHLATKPPYVIGSKVQAGSRLSRVLARRSHLHTSSYLSDPTGKRRGQAVDPVSRFKFNKRPRPQARRFGPSCKPIGWNPHVVRRRRRY